MLFVKHGQHYSPKMTDHIPGYNFINLEPLELRKLKNDLVMYFKCLNTLVELPSDEYFYQHNHTFHTRLIIPLCNTNHLKKLFY